VCQISFTLRTKQPPTPRPLLAAVYPILLAGFRGTKTSRILDYQLCKLFKSQLAPSIYVIFIKLQIYLGQQRIEEHNQHNHFVIQRQPGVGFKESGVGAVANGNFRMPLVLYCVDLHQ
jgi:hypothetical protein